MANPSDPRRNSRTTSLPPALAGRTLVKDMWVRSSSNLRQQHTREEETNITPASGQKFLELADVALGARKAVSLKTRTKSASAAIHLKRKSAPYSS